MEPNRNVTAEILKFFTPLARERDERFLTKFATCVLIANVLPIFPFPLPLVLPLPLHLTPHTSHFTPSPARH